MKFYVREWEAVNDSTKRGGKVTFEIFTVMLCKHNFTVFILLRYLLFVDKSKNGFFFSEWEKNYNGI